MTDEQLLGIFRGMFDFDTYRIEHVGNMYFLIVGNKRNTKDDGGLWVDGNGNRVPDWDYMQETAIASGETRGLLLESARRYEELLTMTWEEVFENVEKYFPRRIV